MQTQRYESQTRFKHENDTFTAGNESGINISSLYEMTRTTKIEV